jgi:hypothetical protein
MLPCICYKEEGEFMFTTTITNMQRENMCDSVSIRFAYESEICSFNCSMFACDRGISCIN